MDDPVQNPYLASQSDEEVSSNSTNVRRAVRQGQIITFAMVQGVVVIAVLFAFMARDTKPDDDMLMPVIGIAVAIVALGIATVIPMLIIRGAIENYRGSADEPNSPSIDTELGPAVSTLVARRQTATLVSQAALDGAATANLVLMLLDGHLLLHGVITGVLIVGIVLQVPTTGKVHAFIARAKRG